MFEQKKRGCCDKCGLEVPDWNNAVMLEMVMSGGDPTFLLVPPRHLLPEVRDGKKVCPGSPSRAQYLEGQPRDPRYPYDPQREGPVRRAHERLKKG